MKRKFRMDIGRKTIYFEVDRNGDVLHGPRTISRFIGKPFSELKKWALVEFNYCRFEDITDGDS